MTRCRPVFLLVLLLTTGMAINSRLQTSDKLQWATMGSYGYLQQFVPERLRSFVAACFWAKADELMHRGPFPGSRQSFQPGSYYGNSDIVPLLNVVIALVPEEPAPYQLLSRLLASLGYANEGLRVLQLGILNNRRHPAEHELYAAAAFLKLFSDRKPEITDLISASRYLDRASGLYSAGAVKYSSDPAFRAESYQVLLARIYLELSEPQRALEAWVKSGQNLETAGDRLAVVLREYRDRGVLPVTRFPPFLQNDPAPDRLTATDASRPLDEGALHRHHDNCGCENAETPPGFPLKKVFLAGFWLGALLLLHRIRGRG